MNRWTSVVSVLLRELIIRHIVACGWHIDFVFSNREVIVAEKAVAAGIVSPVVRMRQIRVRVHVAVASVGYLQIGSGAENRPHTENRETILIVVLWLISANVLTPDDSRSHTVS